MATKKSPLLAGVTKELRGKRPQTMNRGAADERSAWMDRINLMRQRVATSLSNSPEMDSFGAFVTREIASVIRFGKTRAARTGKTAGGLGKR